MYRFFHEHKAIIEHGGTKNDGAEKFKNIELTCH